MARLFSLRPMILAVLIAASFVLLGGGQVPPVLAGGSISTDGSWIRLPAAAGRPAAGYLIVENSFDEAVRLIGLASSQAERIEIHESREEAGVMRMRRLDFLEISPGDRVELAPGGIHLMLFGLNADIKAGDVMRIDLEFEKASGKRGTAPVRFMVHPFSGGMKH